jgi:hypothetical protein
LLSLFPYAIEPPLGLYLIRLLGDFHGPTEPNFRNIRVDPLASAHHPGFFRDSRPLGG